MIFREGSGSMSYCYPLTHNRLWETQEGGLQTAGSAHTWEGSSDTPEGDRDVERDTWDCLLRLLPVGADGDQLREPGPAVLLVQIQSGEELHREQHNLFWLQTGLYEMIVSNES